MVKAILDRFDSGHASKTGQGTSPIPPLALPGPAYPLTTRGRVDPYERGYGG